MRFTAKNGDPPGAGKIWENRFYTGKMGPHWPENAQMDISTCQRPRGACQNFFSFTIQAVAISFLKVTHQTYPKWSKSHMYLWDLLHLYLFRTDFVFLCNIFQLPHLNYLRGDTLNQILLDLLLSSRPQQWSTFQCDGLIDIFSGHHRLWWFFND